MGWSRYNNINNAACVALYESLFSPLSKRLKKFPHQKMT